MAPRNFPLMLLAAGVVAAVALARKTPGTSLPQGQGAGDAAPQKFVLAKDAPALDLRRGELLRVEPEAPIRLGDVVALKSAEPELVLTRFHDELMHCVAGLVVRETQSMTAT